MRTFFLILAVITILRALAMILIVTKENKEQKDYKYFIVSCVFILPDVFVIGFLCRYISNGGF